VRRFANKKLRLYNGILGIYYKRPFHVNIDVMEALFIFSISEGVNSMSRDPC